MEKYYSLWTESGKERKITITSQYTTTCKDGESEFTAFICRMSNGMTFYTGKNWCRAFLTRHQVRKGTNVNNCSDVDLFSVNDPIETIEDFTNLIYM